MDCKLLPTNIKVKTYSNEPLYVLGKLKVKVNVKFTLYIYVIDGNGPSLLGRDWLNVIKLNWNDIFKSYGCNVHVIRAKWGY